MSLSPGAVVNGRQGSYRLKNLLGKGGMGEVWLAEPSAGTYELVAIKFSSLDRVAREKLLFERQVLRQLKHDHIVGYFDEGEQRGVPFLVMEYIPGENFEILMRKQTFDESDAVAVTVQTLLALDYIHSKNIVHRDVKPKNLLAKNNSIMSVKLIDFGTSTFYNKAGVPEAVISPGGFTAPEQYNGVSSPQADIWSTGALLFYLLTRRYPQEAMPGYPSARPKEPISVRRYNRDVSEEIETIVRKAMAWNPSERFLSAREMIEAIEGAPIEEGDVPVLEVMGVKVKIETDSLIFGRLVGESHGEKVKVLQEGGKMLVLVADPYNWISRRHFEIFRMGGKWYIRDLGSLNRTAVQSGGRLVEVWAGPKRESQPLELGSRAVIYLAYGASLNNPPYLVATFKAPK